MKITRSEKYKDLGTTFIGNINNRELTVTKIHEENGHIFVTYESKGGSFVTGYEVFKRLDARVKEDHICG